MLATLTLCGSKLRKTVSGLREEPINHNAITTAPVA